jgi:cytochrome c2
VQIAPAADQRHLDITISQTIFAGAVMASVQAPAANAQDVGKGANVFKTCRDCHDVRVRATNKTGPVLHGIFGWSAGTAHAFDHSSAMRDAASEGLIWSAATLDKYLRDPRAFVPGAKTAFMGLSDASARKDLIAYLRLVRR